MQPKIQAQVDDGPPPPPGAIRKRWFDDSSIDRAASYDGKAIFKAATGIDSSSNVDSSIDKAEDDENEKEAAALRRHLLQKLKAPGAQATRKPFDVNKTKEAMKKWLCDAIANMIM